MLKTLKASPEGLLLIDQARKSRGWTKTRTPDWWIQAKITPETLRDFWRGFAIDENDFIAICQAVGMSNWQEITAENTVNLSSSLVIPTDFQGKRTLAAIVFTDTVSFSKKMSENEEHTLNLVQRDLQMMTEICDKFSGQVLKSTGDGLLMYFTSAIQAVACATEIQEILAKNAEELPTNDILEHRIGIHLGDVFFSERDVMGNGVNIAARLQTQAEPGGICISQTVYDVVKNSLTLKVNYLGAKELKNIADAVPVYQILIASQKAREITNNSQLLPKNNLKQAWGSAPDIT